MTSAFSLASAAFAPPQDRLVLAAGSGANQPSGQGQEFGSSGPVALILIIVLFVAVAFLIRSMSKHLKRVPATFDEPDPRAEADSPVGEAPPADGPQPAPDGTEVGHGSER